MPIFLSFYFLSFFITTLQAQDTIVIRDDYKLAVQEAQAGKKIVLAIYNSEGLELPAKMDPALTKNLIGLFCDNCHLTHFPKGLENCSALEAVEINWYLFGEAPDNSQLLGQIFQLPHLKILDIHGSKAPTFPFKSTTLELLSWTKGNLTAVPNWVYQQTNLKILRLGCNNIQTIGEEIGNLTVLQQFSLGGGACGGNPIKKLPKSLVKLKQLTSFDLDYGQLKTFPSVLWQLPKLQHLSFHYAGIENIADNIPTGKSFRSFRLSEGEEFLGFPPSFANLQFEKLIVDVHQPTCAAIQSQTILESLKASVKTYEVSFRATPFPEYIKNNHITNQIIGVWKASKKFSLFPNTNAAPYLFLLGSHGYLSSTIQNIPAKYEYGKVVYDYEQKHAIFSFHKLQYTNNCVYGVVRKERGTIAARQQAGKMVFFSFEYDEVQDVLTVRNVQGEVTALTRVQ